MGIKIISNNGGFSLVTTLVALAVSGLLMAAISTSMINQHKATSFIEDRVAKTSLHGQIASLLMDRQACTNSFRGADVTRGTQIRRQLKNKNNTNIYDLDGTLVNFDKINLDNFILDNIDVPATPNSSGRVTLTIPLSRQRAGGGNLAPVTIELTVNTDINSLISNCRALGDGAMAEVAAIVTCNEKLTFYKPLSPLADADGCVDPTPETHAFPGARIMAAHAAIGQGSDRPYATQDVADRLCQEMGYGRSSGFGAGAFRSPGDNSVWIMDGTPSVPTRVPASSYNSTINTVSCVP